MPLSLARPKHRLAFDPEVGGLAALGIERPEQLLGDEGFAIARAEAVASLIRGVRLRFPLPGTARGPGGRLTGRPAGSATGWVVLERFRGSSWRELLAARLTHPRSASLAERRWNLLCHLRACGVGTPEPLAVGARGEGPVSRDSFLVTRELEGFEPLGTWLAREHGPRERRRGLRALAAFLAALFGARVRLPRLAAEQLRISAEEGSCSLRASPVPAGLVRNRMPSVVLTEVDGGEIRDAPSASDLRALLCAVVEGEPSLTAKERAQLAVRSLRAFPPAFRRDVLAAR